MRNIFLNIFTNFNYSDEEISVYWLSRQSQWKHEKRKIRVAFVIQGYIAADKILPVYEAMQEREDIIPFLILHPSPAYKYNKNAWAYLHKKYSDKNVYESGNLMDLRKLRPDYVFFNTPYDKRRDFPSFKVNDVVKFAKVCVIPYGANLTYTFINRLFDDFMHFWRNVYMIFCSAKTGEDLVTKRFSQNTVMNYQHIKFYGYPVLKTYYDSQYSPSPYSF